MPTLLVKNAALVVTMDAALGDIPDGAIFCQDGVIRQIGPAGALPRLPTTCWTSRTTSSSPA